MRMWRSSHARLGFVACAIVASTSSVAGRLLVDEKFLPDLSLSKAVQGVSTATRSPADNTVRWEATIIGAARSDFIRVHVYVKGNAPRSGWFVRVLDETGRLSDI